jgi:hypothetical protein
MNMKVEVRAIPKIYFQMSRVDIELLMQCAKQHYDGECQRAVMSADLTRLQPGSHRDLRRQNGFLVVLMTYFADHATSAEVSATGHELDLLMKITEQWVSQQWQEKTQDVQRLHRLFRQLFDLSQRAYSMWKLEVEL